LHIEQMHPCLLIMLTLFCRFDFSSAYNHNAVRGTPIAKKISIVRTGTRRTNSPIPKHNAAIARIEIQRVVGSMNTPYLTYGISSLMTVSLEDNDLFIIIFALFIAPHSLRWNFRVLFSSSVSFAPFFPIVVYSSL
jgi:hypothetical protein